MNDYHTRQLNDVVAPGGSLNPTWVEWLMGWPLGWTDLKPLEMGKFQQWCERHGTSCAKKEPPQDTMEVCKTAYNMPMVFADAHVKHTSP
jgi:hypothetical protein